MHKEKNKIKVLLINPPQKYYKKSGEFNVYFPIGLLSIASVIREVCDLELLDCLVTGFKKEITQESVCFGMPFKEIREYIKTKNPRIVGISVPFTTQAEMAFKVCELCKEINPCIVTVFGGPDASVRYTQLLDSNCCDYVIVGEGEFSFLRLIKHIDSPREIEKIKGVAFKRNNKIQYNPCEFIDDLDALPLPAYDLIRFDDYFNHPFLYNSRSQTKENSISIITSRGCPFHCIFCSIKLHMGRKYRYHSPDYVINHISFLKKTYGIRFFHFEDDNLTLNKKRFSVILKKICEDNLDIQWDTPNGIRADTLSEPVIIQMKKAGCAEATIAVESGNQRVLDHVIKKNLSLKKIKKIIGIFKKYEIPLNSFYVIGFPGETIAEMKDTVSLASELYEQHSVVPYLFFATPMYGTELHNICVKEGIVPDNLTPVQLSKATYMYGDPLISTDDFSVHDLKKIIFSFLLKIKQIGEPEYIKRYMKNRIV